MSRLVYLTGAVRDRVPACCADCVFWQSLRGSTDRDQKRDWSRRTESHFGAWGRALWEGDTFRGLLQYGPATVFARAQVLPAGPPDRAAGLVTCSYLVGDDLSGTCERLVLEALADFKAREFVAVEAFALNYPDEVPLADRFLGHHTLFDRTFLASLGFLPVRSQGQVALMRLELGGLQEDPRPGVLARLLPARDPTPHPA